MRLLALLGMKLFVYDDAEFLLESCVELAPDYWLARYDYVNVLHKRQKFEKALEQAGILLDAFPDNHAFQLAYANENVAVGHFDAALAIYDKVIEKHPAFAQPYLTRGHALKTIGRLEEAIESYRAAYRVRPHFGDAFWSLANLKTYRFSDEEIARMLDQLDTPASPNVDRFHLCFALGAAYEAREDYARSFTFYERGNLLKKQDLRYDPDRLEQAMQRQVKFCTPELFASKAGMGSACDDPIFIVGLPRAGSTLLEQILASHSLVDGTMELPNIIALAHRLNGRGFAEEEARYPAILADQGLFAYDTFQSLHLPESLWSLQALEFHGQMSFIKGGIAFADRITTVSPTYAREIQTTEHGYGLDALLRHRSAHLSGILNGIDERTWNPARDPHLVSPYAMRRLTHKAPNKAALQKEFGLPIDADITLLGLVSRLVHQKGIDLVLAALPELLDLPVQFVALGSGEPAYEHALRDVAIRSPERIAVLAAYDEAIAYRIQAGADIFLMPSRFEPCGLSKLYSLRYGTVPLVRRVGGLADTVTDATPDALTAGTATGIVFDAPTPTALVQAVKRALRLRSDARIWKQPLP